MAYHVLVLSWLLQSLRTMRACVYDVACWENKLPWATLRRCCDVGHVTTYKRPCHCYLFSPIILYKMLVNTSYSWSTRVWPLASDEIMMSTCLSCHTNMWRLYYPRHVRYVFTAKHSQESSNTRNSDIKRSLLQTVVQSWREEWQEKINKHYGTAAVYWY